MDNLIIGGWYDVLPLLCRQAEVLATRRRRRFGETAKAAIEKAKANGVNPLIPTDTVVADKFSDDANNKHAR